MRMIDAFVEIEFDEYSEKYKEEFDRLGSESDDPIGQYIKLAKARGETKESDPVLLELLIALHRKVDELTALIKKEDKKLLPLKYKSEIIKIGFENFKIKDRILNKGARYYGRMNLAVFPPREIPVVFEAVNEDTARIVLMHERDEKDYNAFITARERAIIREMRAKK